MDPGHGVVHVLLLLPDGRPHPPGPRSSQSEAVGGTLPLAVQRRHAGNASKQGAQVWVEVLCVAEVLWGGETAGTIQLWCVWRRTDVPRGESRVGRGQQAGQLGAWATPPLREHL